MPAVASGLQKIPKHFKGQVAFRVEFSVELIIEKKLY